MRAPALVDVINAVDYEATAELIAAWLADRAGSAGLEGYVVGLSGGVDSTVAAALAVKAVGAAKVLGVVMPSPATPQEDVEDAVAVARQLGIAVKVVHIGPILEAYARQLEGFDPADRLAAGNLHPRVRASILYYYANRLRRAVLGTGDRSEILLGYFTKYGDGAVDLLPIGGLYKTQVREMARRLGFPKVAAKESSPRLWPGHTAREELGARYEELDPVLYAIFDLGMPLEEAREAFGRLADLVVSRYAASAHKRATPPIGPVKRL